MSRRAEQASSVLQRAVQSVLVEGLSDPRLDAMITVTGVRVTPDMNTAIVSVSIMPEAREKLAMHGLTAAARHIRRRIGELVALHNPPELIFKLDRGAKRERAIMEALSKVKAERETPPEDPTEPQPDQAPSPPEDHS